MTRALAAQRRSPEPESEPEGAEAERRRRAARLLAAELPALRRTARRFSICAADADDAVQRAAEILLTREAPSEPGRLAAWMHVVTRHEALAVRRERLRQLGAADQASSVPGPATDSLELLESARPRPDELAERREQLRARLAALAALKPHERLAIVLQAQGYSYAEIARGCGWTYTKVNRCLAEGRARLRAGLAPELEPGPEPGTG